MITLIYIIIIHCKIKVFGSAKNVVKRGNVEKPWYYVERSTMSWRAARVCFEVSVAGVLL